MDHVDISLYPSPSIQRCLDGLILVCCGRRWWSCKRAWSSASPPPLEATGSSGGRRKTDRVYVVVAWPRGIFPSPRHSMCAYMCTIVHILTDPLGWLKRGEALKRYISSGRWDRSCRRIHKDSPL